MVSELERINERLRKIHAGRKWIVAGDVAAGAKTSVDRLREWGVADVMVVAALPGVGPLPEEVEIVYTGATGEGMMAGFRAFRDDLVSPGRDVATAVDRFDPERNALVLTNFWSLDEVLGRSVYGPRTSRMEALEDKMIVDALWDEAGVHREPAAIVAVEDAAEAHDRVSGPLGSVWAADNTQGWHGGGEYTRWVRSSEDKETFTDWFGQRSSRVRVMPFLDGIPCSIHGFVTADYSAAFRPVEMVIMRRPGYSDFRYAGVASFWDPRDGDREDMRAAARAVGDQLRKSVGYRGPFSIDGVMTSAGFRPTELNPRPSAGLALLASTVEGLQLGAIVRATLSGDLEVDGEWLEDTILDSADAGRAGGMGLAIPDASLEPSGAAIMFDEDGAVRVADPYENADATLSAGDSASGVYIRMVLDPERIAPGPSVAPLAVAAAEFVEREWAVPVGKVEAAPDLRPSRTDS